MVFLTVLLAAGLAVTAIELSSWRAREKGLSLTGPVVIALAAAGLLDARPDLQAGALLIGLALVLTGLLTGGRAAWRRPETILLGFAALVMAAHFLPGVPGGIQEVLSKGFVLLLAASFAVFLWRVATDMRESKRT